MSVKQDQSTFGATRLSFAREADIDEFIETLGRFERGEMAPDAWRAFRLVHGVYGQRQTGDVQMLRVKVPQGALDAVQLGALADVAATYSRGFGHVTTRQNVQFHFVRLHDVEPAMRRLAEAGLTTTEACGNAVRNVTACPYAGVSAAEVFDVTPYAEALTRHLLRHPLSSTLPRKFKIAFEGCPEDHARTAINDLGFQARVTSGRRGFRVVVGGGTSISCASAAVLYDFLPAAEILAVAEAVVRVFHRLGDYRHRQRNRLKFLIRSLGWERWREEFETELGRLRADGAPALAFDPDRPPAPAVASRRRPSVAALDDCATPTRDTVPPMPDPSDVWHWRQTNVSAQKQAGFVVVAIVLVLGDVTASQLRSLASLAERYGDGTVRMTPDQNVFLRWVKEDDLPSLFVGLAAAGLATPGAGTISDVTSCPGAETCRLAVTQSRGLARLLRSHIEAGDATVERAADLQIKISGCPNGCGQHHVAGIGFQGSVRKVAGRPLPMYFVTVGGAADGDGARFGRLAAKVPAHRCGEAVDRMVSLYSREARAGEGATAFFQRVPVERVTAAIGDLADLSGRPPAEHEFIDPGDEAAFSPEVLDGECSA